MRRYFLSEQPGLHVWWTGASALQAIQEGLGWWTCLDVVKNYQTRTNANNGRGMQRD